MAKRKHGAALDRCGMMEAAKVSRRLKAYKHLPSLRAALTVHQDNLTTRNKLEENLQAA